MGWRGWMGAALAAGSLMAQEASPIGGYVQLMTNYVGRGLAQSVGQPSVQAELSGETKNGVWGFLDATSINWVDQLYPGDGVSLELDAVLGYQRRMGELTWKVGVLRLQFPGRYVPQDPPVEEPHTTEVFGRLYWRRFYGKLNVSTTNAFGTPGSKGSFYLDLGAAQPLAEAWTLELHLGRKETRGHDPATGRPNSRFDYWDYKVGLTWAPRRDLSLALARTWTTADPVYFTLNGYRVGGPHLALTLQKTF